MPCVSLFGIISSGCSTSTETSVEQLVETQIVTNILKENRSSITDVVQNVQNITLSVSGLKGCDVDIDLSQKLNSQMETTTRVTQDQVTDMKSQLDAKVEAFIANIIKLNTDYFANATGAETLTKLRINIRQIIENNIEEKNINQIVSSVNNIQNAQLNVADIVAAGGTCRLVVTQDIFFRLIADRVIMQIQKDMIDNKEIAEATTDIENNVEVTQSGLWSGIKEGFKFLKSIGTGVLIGFIAILALIAIGAVLLVILLVKLGKTPAGQDVLRQAPALLAA